MNVNKNLLWGTQSNMHPAQGSLFIKWMLFSEFVQYVETCRLKHEAGREQEETSFSFLKIKLKLNQAHFLRKKMRVSGAHSGVDFGTEA